VKTVPFQTVWESIVRLRGWNPDSADISSTQKQELADHINEALEEAWQDGFFPDVMLIEQRQYRPDWDAATTYGLDEEVLWEDSDGNLDYYASLQAGNLNHSPSDTDWWEKQTSILYTIDFQQDGETEIDAVDTGACIYSRDPRIYAGTQPNRTVEVYDHKILVRADAPTQPWVRFRPVAPEFSLDEWSAVTAYAIDDVVYLASQGECYKALAASTNKDPYTETAYWEPVDFPKIFMRYVRHKVHSLWLMEDEGRYREAAAAEAELEKLHERQIDQTGHSRRATFVSGY
jgi:hypothetical protein